MKTTCFTILAVICLLVGTGSCEEILRMSANTTTVRIQNVCPDGLNIGNLNIVRGDYNTELIGTTGSFILPRGSSAYVTVDQLEVGNTLMLTSNSYEVFASCVVENRTLEPSYNQSNQSQ